MLTNLRDRRPGQRLSLILIFVSVVLYIQIAFFIHRTETTMLIISYAMVFVIYLLLTKSILSFRILLGFGILFRLLFLFAIPNLSDDFYRFFWDGILNDHAINPFMYLPREIIDNPSILIPSLNQEIFQSLNSPDYYSVYPPVCQFVFWLSANLSGGDLNVAVFYMKIMIFLAEIGSIFLVIRLLNIYKMRKELALLYILNPLVIIELVGNIHFEAFMIVFVLLGVFLLNSKKILFGAVAFALAISSKLTPILLLPFFLKRLKVKKALVFYLLTLGFTAITFLPFLDNSLISGMSSSIGLYFQKFEFNASIFYIVRAIGFWIKGWDIIQEASKWFALITISLILLVTFFENTKKQNLPGVLFWALFIYFSMASIIHPWYATPLVAFSLFSRYRFPLIWSFTIFLSYAGYSADGFQEQLWVLFMEYLPVYGYLIYELIKYNDLISFKKSLQVVATQRAKIFER